MPVLELSVDATKMIQGLRQAEPALDQLGRKAKTAEEATKRIGTTATVAGNNLSAAFAATGGGLSVTRGLVGMTDGLRRADGAMAGFAASQALLDLGRFSADMRAVGAATGATGGAFSKLGAIIKANPLLAIAGALAGAASLMGLFKSETDGAADAFERLAKAQRDARLSEETRSALGLSALSAKQKGLQSIEGSYEESVRNPRARTIGDLAKELGVDPSKIQGIVGGVYPENPRRALPKPGIGTGAFASVGESVIPVADRIVSPAVVKAVFARFYADVSREVEAYAASENSKAGIRTDGSGRLVVPGPRTAGAFDQGAENQRIADFFNKQRQRTALGPGESENYQSPFFSNERPTYGEGTVRQTSAQRSQVETDIFDRNTDLAKQRMDELIRQGERFGATVGDAFFNVASGAQTARQAIAAIVSDLARATSQRAFASLFGQVAGSFGQTGTQSTANNTAPAFLPIQ